MKAYNLYYLNEKINKRPLSESSVNEIMKYPYISKINKNESIIEIETKKIKIIKCTIL